MTIPQALRGLGREVDPARVNSYGIREMLRDVPRGADDARGRAQGHHRQGECSSSVSAGSGPGSGKLRRRRAARSSQPRFGVDPDVCTGDHSCMRLNGCPSLTLRESPDALREDPIAHVDDTCVGCGVCGEVAHAAVLCPSFYEVEVITNPDPVDRGVAAAARRHPPPRRDLARRRGRAAMA